MDLQPCPCCRGESIFADLRVGKTLMWQVSCTACGLSSELDEDKVFTAERWNLRQETASLKVWITALSILTPAAAIICFLLGTLLGINLNR